MDLKTNLERLRDDVRDLIGEQNNKIDPLMLSAELDRIIRNSEVSHEYRWRRYQTRHRLWQETRLEMTRAVMAFGQGAIRSLLLINGGASIAVLTFLGNFASDKPSLFGPMSNSLLLFCTGLVLAGFVAGLAYCTQFLYDQSVGRLSALGKSLHIISVVGAILSIAAFVFGVWLAYLGFQDFVNVTT